MIFFYIFLIILKTHTDTHKTRGLRQKTNKVSKKLQRETKKKDGKSQHTTTKKGGNRDGSLGYTGTATPTFTEDSKPHGGRQRDTGVPRGREARVYLKKVNPLRGPSI